MCNHCGMCCRLIPVNEDGNYIVRDGFQILEENFSEYLIKLSYDEAKSVNESYVNKILNLFPNAIFYKCKYNSDTNTCTIDDKPYYCSNYPSTPVAIVPDECSHLGSIFIKNEALKQRIRKIKEEILDYEVLISLQDKDSSSYRKIIENLNRFIKKYADFGANDW
ncbi:YkgJ family cysteine cluster protein [bacterium]|nr:YkgJ family cysteine cluster protein [bacterium]